jgi:hypothetical protein
MVRRDDNADGDEGSDMISVVGAVGEFAGDKSATISDETIDVAVNEVVAAAGPE